MPQKYPFFQYLSIRLGSDLPLCHLAKSLRRCLSLIILVAFFFNSVANYPMAQAQEFTLPTPGSMVPLSHHYNPPILKGIKVHPENPFQFDFILSPGDSVGAINNRPYINTEATRLIKYFLASLTIPENDLWVNLSPYEKNRIIPPSFGQTEMGRDLLAEDYMLKQITASLIYPEGETGKKFWKKIYEEVQQKFGTTNIPVNTFNKVWIIPEKAVVYENTKAGTAYVVESKLKVMLEEDYLSLQNHTTSADHANLTEGNNHNDMASIGANIIREIVIPELTKEVNQDQNFAQLRQVYNSLILATWYKKKIKDSILDNVYANKNKVSGLSFPITSIGNPQYIYQQYLKAFKKGVYNYIKDEINPITQETIPRKYFSGGMNINPDKAMTIEYNLKSNQLPKSTADIDLTANLIPIGLKDKAMKSSGLKKMVLIPALITSPFLGKSDLTDSPNLNEANNVNSANVYPPIVVNGVSLDSKNNREVEFPGSHTKVIVHGFNHPDLNTQEYIIAKIQADVLNTTINTATEAQKNDFRDSVNELLAYNILMIKESKKHINEINQLISSTNGIKTIYLEITPEQLKINADYLNSKDLVNVFKGVGIEDSQERADDFEIFLKGPLQYMLAHPEKYPLLSQVKIVPIESLKLAQKVEEYWNEYKNIEEEINKQGVLLERVKMQKVILNKILSTQVPISVEEEAKFLNNFKSNVNLQNLFISLFDCYAEFVKYLRPKREEFFNQQIKLNLINSTNEAAQLVETGLDHLNHIGPKPDHSMTVLKVKKMLFDGGKSSPTNSKNALEALKKSPSQISTHEFYSLFRDLVAKVQDSDRKFLVTQGERTEYMAFNLEFFLNGIENSDEFTESVRIWAGFFLNELKENSPNEQAQRSKQFQEMFNYYEIESRIKFIKAKIQDISRNIKNTKSSSDHQKLLDELVDKLNAGGEVKEVLIHGKIENISTLDIVNSIAAEALIEYFVNENDHGRHKLDAYTLIVALFRILNTPEVSSRLDISRFDITLVNVMDIWLRGEIKIRKITSKEFFKEIADFSKKYFGINIVNPTSNNFKRWVEDMAMNSTAEAQESQKFNLPLGWYEQYPSVDLKSLVSMLDIMDVDLKGFVVAPYKQDILKQFFFGRTVLNVGLEINPESNRITENNIVTGLRKIGINAVGLGPILHPKWDRRLFKMGLIERIPWPRNSFDDLIALTIFDPDYFNPSFAKHYGHDINDNDYDEIVAQITRVLKPGGRFYVDTLKKENIQLIAALERAKYKITFLDPTSRYTYIAVNSGKANNIGEITLESINPKLELATAIERKSDLEHLVELPWLKAAQLFYDLNIETTQSSANMMDLATGEVWINLSDDSLSDANKLVVKQQGYVVIEGEDGRKYVHIVIKNIDDQTTVAHIEDLTLKIVAQFHPQPLLWGWMSEAKVIQEAHRIGYKKITPRVLKEITQSKYNLNLPLYDPQTNGYYRSEEFLIKVKKDLAIIAETKKSNTGGIDLTPANMNVQTKYDNATQGINAGIKFHLDAAMLAQLQNAAGFEPEIINIQPIKSIPEFLGITKTPLDQPAV